MALLMGSYHTNQFGVEGSLASANLVEDIRLICKRAGTSAGTWALAADLITYILH